MPSSGGKRYSKPKTLTQISLQWKMSLNWDNFVSIGLDNTNGNTSQNFLKSRILAENNTAYYT